MGLDLPANYLLYNAQSTKKPSLVIQIAGLSPLLTNRTIYTRVHYGDPGLTYGQPGVVYGGLRKITNADGSNGFMDILSLDGSSLQIAQRLEQEQGKASISTFTLSFIDLNGFMTQLVSPGILIPEIMGVEVKIFLGYEEVSFPQDYYQVFRGYVTSVSSAPGLVTLALSDPNVKLKQALFYTPITSLSVDMLATDTTCTVSSTGDFPLNIVGPTGGTDTSIQYFIQIDSEWMQYTGVTGTVFTGLTRGARGTIADVHTASSGTNITSVTLGTEITGDAIQLALKFMLSGWNGPFISNIPLAGITATQLLLPDKQDANINYGLIEGDFVTTTGSAISGNNVTNATIVSILPYAGQANRLLTLSTPLTAEGTTTAVAAFRSQFDVLNPDYAGLMLSPKDVDVTGHLALSTTFLNDGTYQYRFFITAQEDSGKSFIETEVYYPIGCFSLTRRGLLSVGIHRPPIADTSIVYLNKDNIVNPQSIVPVRALNNRNFFNEVDFNYNPDDSGNFLNLLSALDADSYSAIGILTPLPISSRGTRDDLTGVAKIEKRITRILSKYKLGTTIIPIQCTWEAASQIEAGDVVALEDNGDLQITNFNTGQRNLGTQLYEVMDRTLDIGSGQGSLKLTSGVGSSVTDRFAVFSPSSNTDVGCTTTSLIIKDSNGAIFPGNESKKWADYVGQNILVRSIDWSVQGEVVLLGIDPANSYKLLLGSALGFTPPQNYVVDIPLYPTTTNPNTDQLYKLIHGHFDHQSFILTTSMATTTTFVVDTNFVLDPLTTFNTSNKSVIVHQGEWTYFSPETPILSAVATTYLDIFGHPQPGVLVTVTASLGFVPALGDRVELTGFNDGGGPYRYI